MSDEPLDPEKLSRELETTCTYVDPETGAPCLKPAGHEPAPHLAMVGWDKKPITRIEPLERYRIEEALKAPPLLTSSLDGVIVRSGNDASVAPPTCKRCGAELVPRCGCGARLRLVLVNERPPHGYECTKNRTHRVAAGASGPSCLCYRINVGPDREAFP